MREWKWGIGSGRERGILSEVHTEEASCPEKLCIWEM
jgi:hypothetical protein